MKNKTPIALATLLVIALAVWIAIRFVKNEDRSYYPITPIAINQNGVGFAGSTTCAECHPKITKSHLHTAHYRTFQKADSNTILGSFKKGENRLYLGSERYLQMVKEDSFFFEESRLVENNKLLKRHKIDLVVGSGTKGQSYLTWSDDELYQLQTSFFTPTANWINSPGYPKTTLGQLRPVGSRCLECHTTYAKEMPGLHKGNRYDKSQIIGRIDCERCHGPSADHVNFHKDNREVTEANHILKIKNLSRKQRLDACALCHSGLRVQTEKKPFSFVTGDTLTQFSTPNYDVNSLANLDVHGNQYGLFTASKCFKQTSTMDCSTCHNPHENQRGQTELFLRKCMDCHTTNKAMTHCSLPLSERNASAKNCIDCHMPLSQSESIKINNLKNKREQVNIRTHLIAIYPNQWINSPEESVH